MIDALLKSGKPITVLLEAENGDGPVYLSNTGYVTASTDATPNRAYPDWLQGVPVLSESMASDLVGAANVSLSDAIIANPNGVRDGWLDLDWSGYDVALLVGDSTWALADFVPVFRGVAESLQANNDGSLRLIMRDQSALLRKPVQETLLTTGPNLDDPVPLTYGQTFNAEPVVINGPLHIYRAHEAACTFNDVRVGGLTISYTDNADGSFTASVKPDGRVTVDVTEATSTASAIIQALSTRRGVTDFDASALASLGTEPLGLYIRGEADTLDLMGQCAASVAGWVGADLLGRVTGGPVEIGTSVLTLTPDDIDKDGVELEDVREPTELIRVGYQKNWSVQTDGLYGAVTDDNRALYGQEYSTESATAVTTVNNPRRPDRLPTLLATQVGAAAVAARLITLYGVQRRRYRVSARRRGWQVSRGDTITIQYPRFGLESGKDFLVTSVERRLDTRSTEIIVWG